MDLDGWLQTRVLGRVLHHYEAISSTNDHAMQLAREGAAHGEVVIADLQHAGRGRRGRSWFGPPGRSLYLSVIIRPRLPARRAPELTSLAAVAVAEAVRELGADATIKWPNDVEIDGRKLGGILSEVAADSRQVRFAVVGVGLNLDLEAEDFPEEIRERATSLRIALGSAPPREAVAAAILGRLEPWLERHEAEGFAPVRSRYRELSAILGQPVRLLEASSETTGVAEDIDEMGALCVRLEDGTIERYLSAELVSLRRGR